MGGLEFQLFGQAFWLSVTILLCIIEGMTFGLVCVWFAGGAVAALIMSAIGFNPFVQYVVFIVVSVLLLIFTRPILSKFLASRKTSTNSDRLIGKTGVVVMDIDPISATGQVKVEGQIWSAKTEDSTKIAEGTEVDITDISGVKLIVSIKSTD